MRGRIAVQEATFDVNAELAALSATGVGGLASFIGVVRGGNGLSALRLEHYPGMTERELARLADAACARWALRGCTIIHRVGRLELGAPIVLVATASAHRADALAATAFLIDQLKTGAPFWKSEEFADGSHRWVAARDADEAAAAAWRQDLPPPPEPL
ncbi:molybdenum cofactor biosynthesis protein MoaE [Acidocella sp. KAb 2-4]|uniref:molybdenum cofactor biosynthesis protein MoaE n=1 Tax=Acidocella sp. KAb 2-4 TaxID=2885158 RepID=UPI001D0979FA|nr:molybdenum cofactor biosynthesis protein MoaE [Acidocella sp. KAb 2-4]MCB5943771.1 molybdenum cofactor biosynthesis protein MoaE [Acidocella sp. KAb 2-4]